MSRILFLLSAVAVFLLVFTSLAMHMNGLDYVSR